MSAAIKCHHWPVAICSWSLRTDVAGVAQAMRQLAVDHVNLALKPAFRDGGEEYLQAVRAQSWKISATTLGFPQEDYTSLESIRATGGIVPDESWPLNCDMFMRAAKITADLGVSLLTLHAGFIEEGDERIKSRLVCLADAAAKHGLTLLLETGQETVAALRGLLTELNHPALGVNFDPANMILYGKGNPIEAVRLLAPWIKHVHIKDARYATKPGAWGTEVPWGQGEVRPDTFLDTLLRNGFGGVLSIEREAGEDRLGDIAKAAAQLAVWSPETGGAA